jgi:hypothetical protein
MLKPAALGGLFIGVLSALPIVGAANCCCCLWIVSGGALAAWVAGQNQPTSVMPGEGALIGGSAGLIGALLWVPIALAFDMLMAPVQQAVLGSILTNARDMPPEARQALEGLMQPASSFRYVIGFIFQFFAGGIFGAIGGVLAAMFFRKDVPPALGGSHVPPIPLTPPPIPLADPPRRPPVDPPGEGPS